jgi:hypothetical protein
MEEGHNAMKSARAAAKNGELENATKFLAAAAKYFHDAMFLDAEKYNIEDSFRATFYELSKWAVVSNPDLFKHMVASIPSLASVFIDLFLVDGVQPSMAVLQPNKK